MRKLKLAGVFLLLTVFMLAGCASFDKRATQILEGAYLLQNTGGHEVAKQYNEGKISEEKWQDFKKDNDKLAKIHTEAVTAMIKYRATKADADKSEAEKLVNIVSAFIDFLQKTINVITKKVEE